MNEARKEHNPHWIVQLLWFAFVGWWAGQAWMVVAWILMATVIGLPLGLVMLNMLPRVIALRVPRHELDDLSGDPRPQRNFIIRALYFLLIGWWASFLWMELAYFLCLTIIGMPIGFRMFDRTANIMTLKR